MALGDKKANFAAEIARREAECEHLRDEVAFLRKQVTNLQEALYAKESPVAYNQMKLDEYMLNAPDHGPSEEEMERKRKEAEITQQYINGLEGPMFADGDDMVARLTQNIGAPIPQSVHGNDES